MRMHSAFVRCIETRNTINYIYYSMKMATNVFLQFLFMLSNDIPSDIVVTLDISIGWPFYQRLTLTTAWMSNHIRYYKVWDEIIYPFLNFNGCTVEL